MTEVFGLVFDYRREPSLFCIVNRPILISNIWNEFNIHEEII